MPGGAFLVVAGELGFVVLGGSEPVCELGEIGGGHEFPSAVVPADHLQSLRVGQVVDERAA